MGGDDIFAGMAAAWREGVSKATIPTGFSVGRGLFSFESERARELRELKTLYGRLKASFDASPFADSDKLTETLEAALRTIFEGYEGAPNTYLAAAFYDPFKTVLAEEFFAFPEVDEAGWERLDISDRADLRNLLLLKGRFLSDWEKRFQIGCARLVLIGKGILWESLDETIAGGPAPSGALNFDGALIDFLTEPDTTIEKILTTFFDDELIRHDLYLELRSTLRRNIEFASGLKPFTIPENLSKVVFPRKAKDKTPVALIDMYLRGSPFVALLEAPLPVEIPDAVRFEHTHIVGGTGHGKTQLLQHLIHHDLTARGRKPPAIIVIDSQGDLIRTISRLALFTPGSDLAERLIIIDPNDVEHPVALNIFALDQSRLETYGPADRERVFNSVVDLYEYMFSALLGAELTQKQGVVFRYLARLMLAIPGATIQTLRELMEDGHPYRRYMEGLDGSARRFFESEFFSPAFAATKKQILRRLWGVLANPVFERMFSHADNRIDLFEAMNDGKIILINTAKDLLKPEGCSIFGRFFIARIAQAAMERATLSEGNRRPAFVYIDEAHDYFDDTIEHLLNQARKFRIGLTLAHQNLDQLSVGLRASIMASTSLKFAGGVSAKDARTLAEDMRTEADFIISMRKRRRVSEFAAYVKNRTSRALRVKVRLGAVNALPIMDEEEYGALIAVNRERYCATLDEVRAILDAPTARKPAPVVAPEPPVTDAEPAPIGETLPTSPPAAPIPTPSAKRSKAQTPDLPPEDPYVTGLGGREHRYLQHLIRGFAQERGFKATVEYPVEGGSIDVALEQAGVRIACEISVTTRTGQEERNVAKCFAAGFEKVVLVVPERRKRQRMQRESKAWSIADRANFHVFAPEELVAFLDVEVAALTVTESTSRGYRVRVSQASASPEDAARRREMISRVIAKSVLNVRKE